MNNFGQFVWEQAKSRDMSLREFANYVGVSSATIVRAVSDNPGIPSIEFLEKLSIATTTDICSLLALVSPGGYRNNSFRPEIMVLSSKIEHLPDDLRAAVDGFISDLVKHRKITDKPG